MELLERDQCLLNLAEWRNVALERGGCIALIGGEAGIGKTALLQEFARQQAGTRILWGACDALFTPRPLAPLHDIARETQGPLLAAVNRPGNRDATFAAALDEIDREAAIVIFEDMHWADEATLDLLKFLGRRIHRTRTLLAVTYRDDEVGVQHPLRFVIGDLPRDTTRRMALSPLSAPAVARLARDAGRAADQLHAITGGNPLFVTEVLAAASGMVPVTVRDAVLARAVKLSPAARAIAELVSVVPGKTDAWLLAQAAHPDDAGIDSCLSIGMVRHEDGALAFRHELARRAFEDSLSQNQQQNLHARVLVALATRPGVAAARVAHHADGARNATEVLRYAPLAASQAAAVGAHREAASHCERALRYASTLPDAERANLQEQFSYECYLTGDNGRALEARRTALEIHRRLGNRMREGDALRWLSRISWFAGQPEAANAYGAEAVDTLERLPPGAELAMAYSNRAQLSLLDIDAEATIEWATRAIRLAEVLANDDILAHALNTLGTIRVSMNDTSGWADLERSLTLARRGGFHEHVGRAYSNLAAMAVTLRAYDRAFSHLNDGLAYCEEHDLESWRLYLLACRARAKLERGDWQSAGDDADTVLRHARATPMARIPALTVVGRLRARRGDPAAKAALAEARELAGPNPDMQRIGTLADLGAEVAWLSGDRESVLREVRSAHELSRRRRETTIIGALALWLWRMGEPAETARQLEQPAALEIAGDWRGAARAWATLGCPYEHATVLARYGGEAEQREALAIFDRLGAAPAAATLRKSMREQGVRGVPRGSRASTQQNSFGLTRREAEILQLLAEGLRNVAIAKRLFVSTKTVDHHVSAILTKLGVQSRAEAVALARNSVDEST